MKRTLFIVLAVLPLVFVGCKSDFGGIKEQKFMGVHGNPKSIKDTRYGVTEKFGDVTEEDILDAVYYEFDKQGHLLKTARYLSGSKDPFYTIINTFENGKCVGSKICQKHEIYYSITTTHSLKSRTSKNETWEAKAPDGEVFETSHIEYEKLKSTVIVKDSDGNKASSIERKYNNKGNLVEFKRYNSKGEVDSWCQSVFNSESQEVERKMMFEGNEVIFIYTYEYGSFDKEGNWTKKMEYQDGVIKSLTIREIEY